MARRGALQVTASPLLGQSTQEAAGEHEMNAGIVAINAYRAKELKKWRSKVTPGVKAKQSKKRR